MTSNCVKPLHLIINKVKGYIDTYDGKKYMILLLTYKVKDQLKRMGKMKNSQRSY